MPLATDRAGETTPALTAPPTGASEPHTAWEPEQPQDPSHVRLLQHHVEITLRGVTVMCPSCSARRDWLLINQYKHVWIRCRCAHQWLEPEITRADFNAMIAVPDAISHPSLEEAVITLGFDGVLAGAYLK